MSVFKIDTRTHPDVNASFDKASSTISYVAGDFDLVACAVIDSIMNSEYAAGRISYEHADDMCLLMCDGCGPNGRAVQY